ncbi:MAG: ATP-binding protein [Nitrospirae bacterium]|nr:ATP-binding protein [Nitrospirota bacterium]
MVDRPFWIDRILSGWMSRPVVWLSGVRRVGKTSLAHMIPNVTYLNCDLASTVRRLEDPEAFFKSLRKRSVVVLDEIHRLKDPSNVLKVAADAFPGLRVLATGSSTLAATKKFRDSLTGRKHTIYLSPVLWDECRTEFGIPDPDRRLLHGGLPEPLISGAPSPDFFAEWMDSYYARDIAELFGVRDRSGFLSLLRLLLYQSGGLLEVSKLASECGISRPTVSAYVEAMSIAHAVFPVRPFFGAGRREIVRRPKVYAFDTGFVTFAREWHSVREEDRGILWEHLVLDSLRSVGFTSEIAYWRDKSGRELDFVLPRSDRRVDTIECKVNPDRFSPDTVHHFRTLYPLGRNWVVSPMVDTPYARRWGSLEVRYVSTRHLTRDRNGSLRDRAGKLL